MIQSTSQGRARKALCVGGLVGIAAAQFGCQERHESTLYTELRDDKVAQILRASFDDPLPPDGRIAVAWSLLNPWAGANTVWSNSDTSIILLETPEGRFDTPANRPIANSRGFLVRLGDDGVIESWERIDPAFPGSVLEMYGTVEKRSDGRYFEERDGQAYMIGGTREFHQTDRPPIVVSSWEVPHED